jgi:hypothetical protein
LAAAPEEAHSATIGAGKIARIVAVAFFGLALLWPICWAAVHGYTLTGSFEESVGYRYFYSLRKMYDPPTLLFTPQGQSINLIQAMIQVALTWSGFPVTQLQPRIDYFCYISVFVFHVLNLGAFAWMIQRIEGVSAIAVSTLFWLVPFYEVHTSGMYTLLQPDYVTTVSAFALVAAGSILRTARSARFGTRQIAFFGIFIATAAATKITFVLFPAIAFAFAILQLPDRKRAIAITGATVGIAAVCGFVIVFADSSWHLSFLRANARGFSSFVVAGSGNLAKQAGSWPRWFSHRVMEAPLYLALIYSTPFFALLALLCSRTKRQLTLAASILAGSAAQSFFLYKRDYPPSLIEAAFMLHLVVFLSVFLIVAPNVRGRLPGRARSVIGPLAATGLLVLLLSWVEPGIFSILMATKQNTADQAVLSAAESEFAGRRLWLVPDNDYRPLSIDSAIMKGGWGQHWLDPDSPTLRAMVPNVDYAFYYVPSLRLDEYNAIFFVSSGDINSDVARLSAAYSISFAGWSCRDLAMLSRATVSVQEIAVCTR